jgi:hypothetical protein
MMDRIDRREFLATGMKTGAALVGLGVVGDLAYQDTVTSAAGAEAGAAGTGAPGPPSGLTTTGVTGPVGVDPDAVQFAWLVGDTRRGAVQGHYRIRVTGPDRSPSTVWD